MTSILATTRRDLLKCGGALTVAFSLARAGQAFAEVGSAASAKPVVLTQVDSFLKITTDGQVAVYSGKVDLGTGVKTALAQIVADELDVAFDKVTIIQGDTATTPDQGPTFGSLSIQNGGMQIRNAAAIARNALLEQAAARLGEPAGDLGVENGVVIGKSGRVSFGELIGGKTFALAVDHAKPPKWKDSKGYKLVGQPVPRVDIPAKVMGTFTYMHDFRVPGMLHGRVIRPAGMGARLESVDESSVAAIPGVVKIVREGNFLAVVARTEWAAIKASQALRATWSDWAGLPDQSKLFEHVRASKIVKDDLGTTNTGDTSAVLARDGLKKLSATYDFAIHTHGSIGPSCAVAEFRDGKLTSWSASQATHTLQKQLARMFTLPPEAVRCIYIEGAGCYGRNGHEDAAADAALLAKVVGAPVRVQWSRADEHGWDPKGPPTLMDMRGAVDADGNVAAWESEFFIPQQTPMMIFVPLISATLSGLPADETIAPGYIHQNASIPYKIPNINIVCHRLETTPLRPSWIRSPGRLQNTYANECFMDELAAAAGADPVEFRRRLIDPADARGLETLDRVAALAKWEKRASPKPPGNGDIVTGRGVSYCKYELLRTYIAAVAEVEVVKSSGMIRVVRFCVAHDCGQIINPDGLRNQIDGNMIQTISRTLIEEVKFNRSMVTSLDWKTYPILTFPEVPEIIIDLIDRPTEKPWGAGEPSASVVPSAISNAVFDATGVRLRSVPYTPEKVKVAMRGGA